MSGAFHVRGYRLHRGRLELAVVAATVPSLLWVLTDMIAGGQPDAPVVILVWLFLLGLLVAISVERESEK